MISIMQITKMNAENPFKYKMIDLMTPSYEVVDLNWISVEDRLHFIRASAWNVYRVSMIP